MNESKYFTNAKLLTNAINELLAKSMAGSLNIVAPNSSAVSLADFGRENPLVTLIPWRHEKDPLPNGSQGGVITSLPCSVGGGEVGGSHSLLSGLPLPTFQRKTVRRGWPSEPARWGMPVKSDVSGVEK